MAWPQEQARRSAQLISCPGLPPLHRATEVEGGQAVRRMRRHPGADTGAVAQAWVTAAAGAIWPGGYLCAVNGAQQAAWVQVLAELVGLTYVNSVAESALR